MYGTENKTSIFEERYVITMVTVELKLLMDQINVHLLLIVLVEKS